MAPTHNAVAAQSSQLDVLTRRAAVLIGSSRPRRKPREVVAEVLDHLRKIKVRRELQGLNHWEEFAPAHLQKIVFRLESRRRRRIEEFYRENHARAMAFARSFLKNLEDAEDAVSEAYVKLLAGETSPEHFMRTLKQIVLNGLTRSKIEARLFVSLDLGVEDDRRQQDREDR